MKNDVPSFKSLIQHACLLAAAATLAGSAHAVTFSSNIQLLALDGTQTAGGFAASNNPLSRSLVNASNSGLNGSTAVDLGVLKASASAPAWDGAQNTPYTYYQATATTGYSDTLTFTRAGGGLVDVSFSFAFDGSVLDGAAQTHRASLGLLMTLSGATGSVTAPGPRDNYYRDGQRDPFYDNYPAFSPCRAGQQGQAALICQQNNYFSFASSGDKAGTATFTFSVLSGQAINVLTEMTAFVYSDPYIPSAALYDFSHTATLTRIAAPAGTSVVSSLVGNLVSADGGVTYAPAIAAAVPEPSTALMLLAGIAALMAFGARRRSRQSDDGRTP